MEKKKTEYQQFIEDRRKRVLQPIDGNRNDFGTREQMKKVKKYSREPDVMRIGDADELEQVAEGSPMPVEEPPMENFNRIKQDVIVYVSKLMDDDYKNSDCDFAEIAVAIETSPDVHLVILLKSKGKEDVSITSGKYYLLENASRFNLNSGTTENISCIVIGPETLVHRMSAREAEKSNHGLKGQLEVFKDDADALLDKLPKSMKLEDFPYDVKGTINLIKGESVFCVKAFVVSSEPQPRKRKFPGRLLKVVDDNTGRFLNVLVPEEFQSVIGCLPNAGDTIILEQFVAHKSQKFKTSMVVATKHSRIKVMHDDDSFQHLKGYTLDYSPQEFVILSAGYEQNYDGCPKEKCFVKKVKYVGDGQYECPRCKGKYLKVALKVGRQLKLIIESETRPKLKVSVFNKEIDNVMEKLGCNEACDLPDKLVDLRIKPGRISPGRRNLPDVLKKIEVITVAE